MSGHCRLALKKKEITKIKRKLTSPCAPSASTGNLQIASPKSWWYCPSCCWQFAFHRGSTPLKRHCNCEKSVHESSTETEREKQGKTYPPECLVTGLTNVHFPPGTHKRKSWNLSNLLNFRACIYQQQVTFSSGLSHWRSREEHIFL